MVARLDADFSAALRDFAASLDVPDSWALLTFYCESRLDPSAHRIGTSYYGLSQLHGSAIRAAGVDPGVYLNWSASKQLREIIGPWYVKAAAGLHTKSPGALWSINLAPSNVGDGSPGNLLYAAGTREAKANAPLAGPSGDITVGSVDAFMAIRAQDKSFLAALAAVGAGQPYVETTVAARALQIGLLGAAAGAATLLVVHSARSAQRRSGLLAARAPHRNPKLTPKERIYFGAGLAIAGAGLAAGVVYLTRRTQLLPPAGGGYLKFFPIVDSSPTRVRFTDDWGASRSGGRSHKGTDIFAPEGTPIVAVADGRVTFIADGMKDSRGNHGLSFHLIDAQQNFFYGTHLSAYEGSDRAVKAGEVIGYVGHSGNAADLDPRYRDHLHFEVHPGGGAPVDPLPYLTQAPRVVEGVGTAGVRLLPP